MNPGKSIPMTDWLIINAELVNEGRRFHADVRVRNGRIDRIGTGLAAGAGERVFDAEGQSGGRVAFCIAEAVQAQIDPEHTSARIFLG